MRSAGLLVFIKCYVRDIKKGVQKEMKILKPGLKFQYICYRIFYFVHAFSLELQLKLAMLYFVLSFEIAFDSELISYISGG